MSDLLGFPSKQNLKAKATLKPTKPPKSEPNLKLNQNRPNTRFKGSS